MLPSSAEVTVELAAAAAAMLAVLALARRLSNTRTLEVQHLHLYMRRGRCTNCTRQCSRLFFRNGAMLSMASFAPCFLLAEGDERHSVPDYCDVAVRGSLRSIDNIGGVQFRWNRSSRNRFLIPTPISVIIQNYTNECTAFQYFHLH